MSKILAVDDDPIILATIESALLLAGHHPVTTARPEEVFALLGEEPIDAMVIDLRMPEISGFELLRDLRGDPRWRMLPVLLLSSDATSESRVKGLRGGADDYLVKPFVADELIARLERMMTRRTTDTGLQGSLERFPVHDLLPYLQNGNKTGFLEIANRSHAFEVLFRDGRIVAATAGRLTGREAVLETLTLTDGFFHFQMDDRPIDDSIVDVGLQGVLLESAWLEDELAARRDALPSPDLPLGAAGNGELEGFDELPAAEVMAWFVEHSGSTLQQLLDAEIAASQRVLLTVAMLHDRGDLTASAVAAPAEVQVVQAAAAKAEDEDLSVRHRLARVLRAFARRGYDHRQGHVQIFFQKAAWESLLMLFATLPEDLLPDRERLFGQLREQGRGVVRLTLDVGSVLFHLQPLDDEKPPKPTLFEISAVSILWLVDDTWGIAQQTCVGLIELAHKEAVGFALLSGACRVSADALAAAPRWHVIESPNSFDELIARWVDILCGSAS